MIDLFEKKNKKKKKKDRIGQQKVKSLLCYRFNTLGTEEEEGLLDRKRKRGVTMETSTPISERRESTLIELEEDSPIGKSFDDQLQNSLYSNDSSDVIPSARKKAGISNDIDIMAVTPPQEVSPDTMDRRLALHYVDIARSSKDNNKVQELHESGELVHDIATNTFAKRSDGQVRDRAIAIEGNKVGVVGEMNENPVREGDGAVVMDEMNKNPGRGENGAVVMDEMNKSPRGGVGEVTDEGTPNSNIKKKVATRLFMKASRKGQKMSPRPSSSKVKLGEGSSKSVMESRACGLGQSPKRAIPMEVDTPPKRRKKQSSQLNQQLLTTLWKTSNKNPNGVVDHEN